MDYTGAKLRKRAVTTGSAPMPVTHNAVAVALALSNLEACLSGGASIEPIHLFASVLSIVDGVFVNEARRIGLSSELIASAEAAGRSAREVAGLSDQDLTGLRRRVWTSLRADRQTHPVGPLELSPATRDVIRQASGLAREAGDRTVTVRHLLLLFLRQPPAVVRPDISPGEPGRTRGSAVPVEVVAGTPVRDLTSLAKAGRLAPVVGRRREIKALARYLQRTSKRNVLLLGEAGVGKTAVVEGLAQRLAEPRAPEFLRRLKLVQIEVADLVAGTAHRGELERRLRQLIDQATSDPDLVLFVDEIHLIMGAGASQGALDVANILKPALARDTIRCIGATTTDEFERHIKPDAALLRRFQVLHVSEPSPEEALEMCRAWARRIEAAQQVVIDDDAIEASVTLGAQLIVGRALPDKAIDLLENAAVFAKISSISFQAVAPTKDPPRIGRAHIESVLFEQYGVSARAAEALDAATIESELRRELVGQDDAIVAIRSTLERIHLRSPEATRPLAVLLFVGPTGVGKTFAAELLSRAMFEHSAQHFARINMSELKEHHELARLIGAPPGFIGHDRPGALFEFTERHPQGVILLDEMEKAHPAIQDYFLQIFDKGEAADSRGRKVTFGRYMFVLTCNRIRSGAVAPIGFSANTPPTVTPAAVDDLAVHFRREFLARMDNIVTFRPLERPDYARILDRQLSRLTAEVASRTGARLEVPQAACERLVDLCMPGQEGVRGFVRQLEQLLAVPLYAFLSEKLVPTVSVDVADDHVIFAT